MFRQGLRRCARPASSISSAVSMARPRAVAFAQSNAATASVRSVIPMSRLSAIYSRAYSTETSAAEATSPTDDAATPPKAGGMVMEFKNLESIGVHPKLIESITQGLGYENMTPVQAKTINPALKGTDIVAQAKTGTGKTIAFLLPLLQRMLAEDPSLASKSASRDARSDDVRGIVLSPTRELAEQIAAEARALAKNTGLVIQTAVGGTNKRQMLQQTRRQGCHLLVATPGRLNDLLSDADSGIEAPNLAAMVLDEADRMLDVGFEKELDSILEMLPSVQDKVRQTMLVSATIPDNVIRLARSMVRANDFEFVQTISENETLTHDKVPQHVVSVSSWTNMFPSLLELLEREAVKASENPDSPPLKAIVYFNTTALVELSGEIGFRRRRERMSTLPSYAIHSKLTQQQRTRAADSFRRATSGILFSSDVTARGMDFPNVTHVIQVDVPRERESYIHRLGRTGRQDKYGEGWLLLPPQSVNFARKMLRGLPLKQDKSIASAEVDLAEDGADMPQYHDEMRGCVSTTDKRILASAYKSMFGQTTQSDALAEDLHTWVTRGWGWTEPPAVDSRFVRNTGLDIRSEFLNVQEGSHFDDGPRSRSRGFDRGGRDDRGFSSRGGGRSSRDDGDPFNAMRRNVRSDDPPRGGRGDRGFGGRGGRGGGRGFSGGNRRGDRGRDEPSW
ncbi:ATP-dependent RNA helicase MSS116, mitochondrial [Geosmithia morbida]|uniref:ATP-dependent RNA helicase n=1 Tax=Geosmithia morbida TaxID=1094350 RepID=A0A9P5D526_9HYPO|nr:ATP-dependent RNA helicase MSS116, mitochondrial [Geosmithia morbida]KAF4126737.1 ATP-dependent RNA helicase MSS116, mitochondrial [Geosmithia morbida]